MIHRLPDANQQTNAAWLSVITGLGHWTGLLDWIAGLTFDPKNSIQSQLKW